MISVTQFWNTDICNPICRILESIYYFCEITKKKSERKRLPQRGGGSDGDSGMCRISSEGVINGES